MNLQHERMLALCDSLNLPFIAQSYVAAAQPVVNTPYAYSALFRQEPIVTC